MTLQTPDKRLPVSDMQGSINRMTIRSNRALLALAAFALSLCLSPASAQQPSTEEAEAPANLLDASDPESIADLMRTEGFKAELVTRQNGAVEIASESGGAQFWLYFQACEADFTGCEVITFSSGFDFETAQLPDVIGDWNMARYSKAYLDADGDPFVEFNVNMKHGVSPENFVDTLHWFTTEMDSFMDHIGWDSTLAEPGQPI